MKRKKGRREKESRVSISLVSFTSRPLRRLEYYEGDERIYLHVALVQEASSGENVKGVVLVGVVVEASERLPFGRGRSRSRGSRSGGSGGGDGSGGDGGSRSGSGS